MQENRGTDSVSSLKWCNRVANSITLLQRELVVVVSISVFSVNVLVSDSCGCVKFSTEGMTGAVSVDMTALHVIVILKKDMFLMIILDTSC